PQVIAVVRCTYLLLMHKMSKYVGFEQAPIERPRTDDELRHRGAHGPVQPAGKGDWEAHLFALEDLAGYTAFEGLSEHGLSSPAVDLETFGQGHDMLH